MVVGLDAYTVSLQSVQQSFCSHYVAIKPYFIFTHTHTHTPPIYFCSDFVYQLIDVRNCLFHVLAFILQITNN